MVWARASERASEMAWARASEPESGCSKHLNPSLTQIRLELRACVAADPPSHLGVGDGVGAGVGVSVGAKVVGSSVGKGVGL